MITIGPELEIFSLGTPQHFRHLTVFPLLHPAPREPFYLTLDETLARRCAQVTEVSKGGRVPELRLVNHGDLPILLLDGEELVGAKQNRVLNLTILAPAHSEVVIPVSCVEQGRWYDLSEVFCASPASTSPPAERPRSLPSVRAWPKGRGPSRISPGYGPTSPARPRA